MAHRQRKKSTSPEFVLLARQIDTKVDSELLSEMHSLKCINAIIDFPLSKSDELVPVGSCVDGSKVTIPGDSGDLDVLVMSNQILLEESLFDYNLHYPAFLNIKLDREHKTFFQNITNPKQGEYLPVYVLKQFHKKLFSFGSLIIQSKTSSGISYGGDFFNVTRNSSVGFERNQLDLDKFLALGYQLHQENLNSALSSVFRPGPGLLKNFFQMIADRSDEQSFQIFLNNDFIKKINQTIEILAEDETEEEDDIEHAKENLNTKMEKCMWKYNTAENKYKNGNFSDQKKIAVSQRDLVENAQIKINANTDSTHIDTDNSCLDQQNREHEDQEKNRNKSDVIEQTNCKGKQLSFRKFRSIDFVPAFKFKGWPRPAEEWIYRKRMWPSKRTMKEVLDVGCQVVAKRPRVLLMEEYLCSNVAKEDNDLSFRLSFALCEVAIAKDMSEQQLLCWRILKAYQKFVLKSTPQAITSYHWKNVIFWVFEEFDKSFWDDSHVLHGVQRSLDFMISCLEQRFLPFYFVRKMNLLHGYNETMITDVCTRVRMIRSSPILYLKRFLKFQGMSNVKFISMDHKTVADVISEKHRRKEINQVNDRFIDCSAIFYKNIFETVNVPEKLNFQSKFNNFAQVLRPCLNTSDDEDNEVKCLSLTIIEMFEKMSFDNKDIAIKTFNNVLKASENVFKNQFKNEEIQKDIHGSNFSQIFESFMTLLSEFPHCLTGERTRTNSFFEKFCDILETMRTATTNVWTRGAESEDEKTKGKVNAAMSLMDIFPVLYPLLRIVKPSTDNKMHMDIELD